MEGCDVLCMGLKGGIGCVQCGAHMCTCVRLECEVGCVGVSCAAGVCVFLLAKVVEISLCGLSQGDEKGGPSARLCVAGRFKDTCDFTARPF